MDISQSLIHDGLARSYVYLTCDVTRDVPFCDVLVLCRHLPNAEEVRICRQPVNYQPMFRFCGFNVGPSEGSTRKAFHREACRTRHEAFAIPLRMHRELPMGCVASFHDGLTVVS